MSLQTENDLIELFRAFLSQYPSMRFGQAVCGVSSWELDDPKDVSDESLSSLITEHLKRRLGDDAYLAKESSMPEELIVALREIRRLEPLASLSELLRRLAMRAGVNLYDIENDELAGAIRKDLADLQTSAIK